MTREVFVVVFGGITNENLGYGWERELGGG
jgi:hypothetical protein